MQKIYSALNSADANLIKGLLQHHGIAATVNGFYLQGGIGELPAMDLVTVSVDDNDIEKATIIVREFENNEIDTDYLDLEKQALESQEPMDMRTENTDEGNITSGFFAVSELIKMMIEIGVVLGFIVYIFFLIKN